MPAHDVGQPRSSGWSARSSSAPSTSSTHDLTWRLFGIVRSHATDEIVADFVGLVRAFGVYPDGIARRAARHRRLPALPRPAAASANYRGTPPLDDDDFAEVCSLAADATRQLAAVRDAPRRTGSSSHVPRPGSSTRCRSRASPSWPTAASPRRSTRGCDAEVDAMTFPPSAFRRHPLRPACRRPGSAGRPAATGNRHWLPLLIVGAIAWSRADRRRGRRDPRWSSVDAARSRQSPKPPVATAAAGRRRGPLPPPPSPRPRPRPRAPLTRRCPSSRGATPPRAVRRAAPDRPPRRAARADARRPAGTAARATGAGADPARATRANAVRVGGQIPPPTQDPEHPAGIPADRAVGPRPGHRDHRGDNRSPTAGVGRRVLRSIPLLDQAALEAVQPVGVRADAAERRRGAGNRDRHRELHAEVNRAPPSPTSHSMNCPSYLRVVSERERADAGADSRSRLRRTLARSVSRRR